jgi:hypothetical protein
LTYKKIRLIIIYKKNIKFIEEYTINNLKINDLKDSDINNKNIN